MGRRSDGTFEHVYVGTTDTDYQGSIDDPQCTKDDITYVLKALNASITTGVTEADITGVWAGLRPLVKSASSGRTADLSRRHKVNRSATNVISVTGGKLTTYREMAQDTVDVVCEVLGVRSKSTTKHLVLVGGDGYRRPSEQAAAHLGDRYGTGATEVAALATADAHLAEPLVPGLPYTKAEAIHAARSEMAVTLDDVLSRRTRAPPVRQAGNGEGCRRCRRADRRGNGLGRRRGTAAGRRVPQLVCSRAERRANLRGRSAGSQSVTQPTAPIELTGTANRLSNPTHQPDDELIAKLWEICTPITGEMETAEASRDWWPLAMHWSLGGSVAQRAAAVCRPTTTEQVSAVLAACSASGVPVTAAGGRSGVSGASIPVFGGVVLDLTAMQGIIDIDAVSAVVEVWAGTFGPDLETELRQRCAMTIGHFPQSFDIATVGGWVACRGAGQYSTRYGKIDTMCVGLEVVLADGRCCRPVTVRLRRWDRISPISSSAAKARSVSSHAYGCALIRSPRTSVERRTCSPTSSRASRPVE